MQTAFLKNDAAKAARIYVLTHKAFTPPPDPLYVPLSVHTAAGDHIAPKNSTFSELTGLYWIWKNDCLSDIVGTAHYRRYLLNEAGGLLTFDEITSLLSEYDCITTKELALNYTYYEGFGENHKPYYLDELRKMFAEKCPADLPLYDKLINDSHTYFGNMMIAPKGLYDAYCSWLFDLLFTLDERITIDEPDSYHRRIYGFISEFLWYFYVKKEGLSAYETMVGMTNEKVETKELKAKLASYFAAGDYTAAKQCFLAERQKRPDLLMEASDITGELHLCMEVIAICEYEAAVGFEPSLMKLRDFPELMSYCRKLNALVLSEKNEVDSSRGTGEILLARKLPPQEADLPFPPSEQALYVARAMFAGLRR